MIRNLCAGHGEKQFGIGFAVGVFRRDGNGNGFTDFAAFNGGFKTRNQHALAQHKFKGVALTRRVEHRAVVKGTRVVRAHLIACFDRHNYSI